MVGIILLIIGIAIAPTINFNTVKASQDDDLVEVTTQACGIKGYGDTTVKLTREQLQDLEEYLVEFRGRLNQTTTREEAILLFKEAVVELDKYGLLPKELSVKIVQKLITERNPSTYPLNRIPSLAKFSNDSNLFCLIAGRTNQTIFESVLGILCYIFSSSNVGGVAYICHVLYHWLTISCMINPFGLIRRISLGSYDYFDNDTYFASGWLTTVGIFGLKKYEGNIIGAIPIKGTYYKDTWYLGKLRFPGVVGFTGFKIGLIDNTTGSIFEGRTFFYLGSALWVSISSEPPSQERTI